MATKGREHTFRSVKTKFKTLFDRAFNTRLEIVLREDFYIDNSYKITPNKGSSLVLLRKTECL
jgi:BMFP domain-containing protein YqiC